MRCAILILFGHLLIQPLHAKRISPEPVAHVVSNGVEYSADGDGRVQYVTATDIATSRQLWKVKIFQTHIKPWIEEDNQWVFITSLTLMENTVLARDEKTRCYEVDLTTKHVKKRPCP
jgi:hypothetical protein